MTVHKTENDCGLFKYDSVGEITNNLYIAGNFDLHMLKDFSTKLDKNAFPMTQQLKM